MIRKTITIDQEKCNGCALCITACHEGAIGMVNGKAQLVRDDYCDGLGDCLPVCPTGAISFVNREAPTKDGATGEEEKIQKPAKEGKLPCGCPGTQERSIAHPHSACGDTDSREASPRSQLRQFPIQLQLVPENASFFKHAHLLVSADCAAYAFGDFHNRFMRGKITLIGCPKLDPVDYSGKITRILKNNAIESVTVVRMEVPCCGGIGKAVEKALLDSGKSIPLQVITIGSDGHLID
ncbi:MAG: ATP-binding protein [Sphaerochaetaceae bacterium]